MRARSASRPRSAILAAAAMLALVGAAFAGALSAQAVPVNVTISTAPGGTLATGGTITGTVAWNGTAGGNVRVDVTDTDGNTLSFCQSDIYLATDTAWACTVDLPVGTNSLQAFAEDTADPGVEIASSAIIFVRGTNDVLTFDNPGMGIVGTSTTMSGTGPIGGTAYIEGAPSDGGPTTQYCAPAPVADDGSWSCAVTVPATDEYELWAAGSNVQGDEMTNSASRIFEFRQPDIQPAISCSFSPGSAVITGSDSQRTEIYVVHPGEGGDVAPLGLCSGRSGNPVTKVGPWDPSPIDDCGPTCSRDLAPGMYNVHFAFFDDVGPGHDLAPRDYFFTVPTSPTVKASTTTGRVSGVGVAGNTVIVSNPGGTQLCSAVVGGAGTWNCSVTQRATAVRARAVQVDAASGGVSSFTGYVTVPALAVAPTPEPTPTPRPWSVNFGAGSELAPGDSLIISGTDAPPGSTIDVELHSTPVLIGSTVATASGAFSVTASIPADAEPGAHHIVVIATPTDGSAPVQLQQAVTVVAAETPEAETVDAGAETAGGSGNRQQPGAPSALSTPLVQPIAMLSDPLALATAGSLGLALVLLVLVPAEFFGEALANHYGAFAGFFSRRKRLTTFVEDLGTWIEENRFWAGAALIAVTSVVFCFVDPGFGFDLTSLRLLLACAGSILLVNFLSSGVTERIAEKAWKVPTRLEVMPWGLAIAIVGVIASRLLNFSPGFLIGSIIGVSVVAEVGRKLEARVIITWCTSVWAIAMASWVLAPLVPSLPEQHPASFFTALLGDTLTATAAGGLTALLVALLPIALFDGGELFRYSKLRWAIAFGIAVASFSIVVLPSASNWLGLGDGLLTWLLLTLGFITLAIVAYLVAVRKNVLSRSRLLKGAGKA
jgi:hypothetical protein